jgi:formylglycine-generating enzyme required for sulfatase activity
MKKFFIIILLAVGCTSHKDNYDTVRKTPKQELTPPGTIWLKGNLFIDETEVTNFGYIEFLYWIRYQKKDEEKYKSLLPDTTCWARFSILNANNYQTYYLRNTAYRNYPVVGISYEQAVEFCKWRSERTNLYIHLKRNKSLKNYPIDTAFKTPEYVRFRLPTKEEWNYAAGAGLNFCNYPMGYEKLTDKNNIPVSNTLEYFNYFKNNYKNTSYKCGDTLEIVYPTEKVFSGKPNRYGIYNMLGNVSELIADSIVKGLNYYEPIFEISNDDKETTESTDEYRSSQIYNYKIDKKYIQPEPWIGFRCICAVLEN